MFERVIAKIKSNVSSAMKERWRRRFAGWRSLPLPVELVFQIDADTSPEAAAPNGCSSLTRSEKRVRPGSGKDRHPANRRRHRSFICGRDI